MAFIGNTNLTQSFTPAIDYFSGNGSAVAFTLSRPVISAAQIQVVVENVPQAPGDAYTVAASTLTFTSAPPSGTNNIYVYYVTTNSQVVGVSTGAVGTSQLANGSVNSSKLDVVSLNGTGAAQIPVGTAAQQPTGAAGYIRLNTTTNNLEYHNGTSWYAITAVNTAVYDVSYLVVAGGGGGGAAWGGGGGAGGFRTASGFSITSGVAYTVTVGAGGGGGANGSDSVFSTITSAGGGGGGANTGVGLAGGSGGGGGGNEVGSSPAGGAGNTPSTSPSQGNNGGVGSSGFYLPAAGGGGAGAVGGNGAGGTGSAGSGGNGTASSISGSSVTYAGGGGGAQYGGSWGAGGTGGGGRGGANGTAAVSGTANTGGGGGGAGNSTVGSGGSGIVIISYPGAQRGTGGTVTSAGGNTIHTFTTSGTYTA
jgi:hypothetical protein